MTNCPKHWARMLWNWRWRMQSMTLRYSTCRRKLVMILKTGRISLTSTLSPVCRHQSKSLIRKSKASYRWKWMQLRKHHPAASSSRRVSKEDQLATHKHTVQLQSRMSEITTTPLRKNDTITSLSTNQPRMWMFHTPTTTSSMLRLDNHNLKSSGWRSVKAETAPKLNQSAHRTDQ